MAALLTGSTVGEGASWRPAILVHTSAGMLRFERTHRYETEDLAYQSAQADAAHLVRILDRALAVLGYRLAER